MYNEDKLQKVMEQYGNTIYKMSYYILQNDQDAQDILQETLIRYMQKAPEFSSCELEKAWILRVAGNLCKDILRFQKRNRAICIEDVQEIEYSLSLNCGSEIGSDKEMTSEIISKIFALKEKYKQVIFLHYYEEYSIKEIAVIVGASEAAVKKRLQRGKEQLKKALVKDRLNIERERK